MTHVHSRRTRRMLVGMGALVLALMVALSASPPARGEPTGQPPSTPAVTTSSPEARLLGLLHANNQMEVRMGQMALEKGQSAGVRDYGQKLVRDHGQSDQDILKLARGLQLDLGQVPIDQRPAEKRQHQASMQRLATLAGAEFDRVFVEMMISDHRKDIAMVEATQARLGNPEVAALAQKTLPILKEHARSAEHLQARLQSVPVP